MKMLFSSVYLSFHYFANHFRCYKNINRNMFTATTLRNFTIKNMIRDRIIFSPFLIHRCMAGHAKWQNVKHVKAERDREKNMLCNKYVRLVTAAIKEKGPDPKQNNKLANLLEEARRNNVPNSTIENAIKRNHNKKLKPGTVEILGPGGCFIIVDFETDNIGDMRHTLKTICKKNSSNIIPGEGGKWRAVFEQKGIVKVTSQLNGESLNQETAIDAAIEAGAEDVQKREDANDKVFFEFLCTADDLHAVKKELEKKFAVEEAYIGYLPISTVLLEDEDLTLANRLLDELGSIPDVTRMFENIE